MGRTGRPLGKTFFLQCQRRHLELPKIPTYLPTIKNKQQEALHQQKAAGEAQQTHSVEITIKPLPSFVHLKHSAFCAKLLLQELDLGSTSEQRSPVGKPVLHMQHTCSGEPAAQRPGALTRLASNNMPLLEHDAQELRRTLYLRAEGIERLERPQSLRQTWKSSIWSEVDDELYTLPDQKVPLVYSLH